MNPLSIRKKKFICVLTLLLAAVCLAMILTCLYRAWYTILVGDDFGHANEIQPYQTGSIPSVITGLRFMDHYYHIWQGTYFSMFLQAFLSPTNYGGLPFLRFDMLLNAVLVFAGFGFAVRSVFRRVPVSEASRLAEVLVYTAVVFCLTGYDAYAEVFTWFSGATSYGYPLALLLVGAGCVFRFEEGGKHWKRWLILSFVCGFAAMGGSLTVAALGCSFLLLYLLYHILSGRIPPVRLIIAFAVWLGSAVLNTAAPGNFIRQAGSADRYGNGMTFPAAFHNSLYMLQERYTFLKDTNWITILLLVLLCGLLTGAAGKLRTTGAMMLTAVLSLAVPVVVIFPVALGYGKQFLPNRTAFIADVAIYLGWMSLSFLVGMRITENGKNAGNLKTAFWLILVLAATAEGLDSYDFTKVNSVEVLQQMRHGEIREHYQNCLKFYELLDEVPDGTDLVLTPDQLPPAVPNMLKMDVDWNPGGWRNAGLCDYFNIKSIAVKDPAARENGQDNTDSDS